MTTSQPISPPDPDETQTFTPRLMRIGFGAVMVVILLIAALSFWRVELGNRTLNEITAHEQVTIEMLYRMQLAARDRTFALFGAVHTDDPFVQDREIQRFYAQGAAFGQAREQLLKLPLTQSERDLLAQQHMQTQQTMPMQSHIIELLEADRHLDAEKYLIEHVVPSQDRMIETLTAMLDNAILRTHEHAADSRRAQKQTTVLFIIGGLAGVLLIWGTFVVVTRKMGGLISRLTQASERLHDSNQDLQFQQQALNTHNIVSIADPAGNIIAVNDKFCEISQYSRRELLGKNHRLLRSDIHPDAFYADLWATISSGKIWVGEICNRRKDGSLYWVLSTILPFVEDGGLPSRYVSVRTDITAIKEAQHVLERSRDELEQLVNQRSGELAEREEILRTITNAAQDAVMMIDSAGLVTYWNPAAERMFGLTREDVKGKDLHDLIVPERYLERARSGFAHFSRSGEGPAIGRTTTLQAKHKNGLEFPVEISLSAISLRGEWNAVGIVRDATERVRAEAQLKQLATTDTLTGICNRRRFDEVLESEIDRVRRLSSPLTLILFDIDHFKRINDTFGHQAGDRVLIQLAVTVSEAIRTIDLFARWGGEEFIVLLPGSDLHAGRLLAEKLRSTLENTSFADVGQVTCSFGVAEFTSADNADTLMKKVDRCLYHAKSAGRNRVETTATTPG